MQNKWSIKFRWLCLLCAVLLVCSAGVTSAKYTTQETLDMSIRIVPPIILDDNSFAVDSNMGYFRLDTVSSTEISFWACGYNGKYEKVFIPLKGLKPNTEYTLSFGCQIGKSPYTSDYENGTYPALRDNETYDDTGKFNGYVFGCTVLNQSQYQTEKTNLETFASADWSDTERTWNHTTLSNCNNKYYHTHSLVTLQFTTGADETEMYWVWDLSDIANSDTERDWQYYRFFGISVNDASGNAASLTGEEGNNSQKLVVDANGTIVGVG